MRANAYFSGLQQVKDREVKGFGQERRGFKPDRFHVVTGMDADNGMNRGSFSWRGDLWPQTPGSGQWH